MPCELLKGQESSIAIQFVASEYIAEPIETYKERYLIDDIYASIDSS